MDYTNGFLVPKGRKLAKLPQRHTVVMQFTLATIADDGPDVLAHEMTGAVMREMVDVNGVGIRRDAVLVDGKDVYVKDALVEARRMIERLTDDVPSIRRDAAKESKALIAKLLAML